MFRVTLLDSEDGAWGQNAPAKGKCLEDLQAQFRLPRIPG